MIISIRIRFDNKTEKNTVLILRRFTTKTKRKLSDLKVDLIVWTCFNQNDTSQKGELYLAFL